MDAGPGKGPVHTGEREAMIKEIRMGGIGCLETIEGTDAWYSASDYVHGDLYEAEELYLDGHEIDSNRLVFVSYPEGRVYEAGERKKGRYFGRVLYDRGDLFFVMADFPEGLLSLMRFDTEKRETALLARIGRSSVKDCYNLMPAGSPPMLIRQGNEGFFEMIWPQRVTFPIGRTETFNFREGERIYFTAWYEDPDYREETIVRSLAGEILERFPGDIRIMPGGEKWHLA